MLRLPKHLCVPHGVTAIHVRGKGVTINGREVADDSTVDVQPGDIVSDAKELVVTKQIDDPTDPLTIPTFLRRLLPVEKGEMAAEPERLPAAAFVTEKRRKPTGRDAKALRELGYGDAVINAMERREAQEIIARQRRAK